MKKNNFSLAAAIIAALALLICVNFFASRLSDRLGLRLDMTGNKLYEVSDETLDILSRLEADVTLTVFSSEKDYVNIVAEILSRYESAGKGRIKLEYIDPYENPTVVDEYIRRGLEINLNTLVVESGGRAETVELEDMFELDSSGSSVQGLKCEQLITSAVLAAAGEGGHNVCFTAGHNESFSQSLTDMFTLNGYETGYVTLSADDFPDDTDLAVIAAPSVDFSDGEISKLDKFMERGGRLLVFVKPNSLPLDRLYTFLAEWGVGVTETVVAEAKQFTDANPLSIVPIYASHEITGYFSQNQLYPVLTSTLALRQEYVSRGDVRTQALLYSTDRAYDFADSTDGQTGPFPLAICAQKERDGVRARLAVIGSGGIYSDTLMQSPAYANSRFIARTAGWCTDSESTVSIAPKSLTGDAIAVTASQMLAYSVLTVGALPLAILVWGIAVYVRRRHS